MSRLNGVVLDDALTALHKQWLSNLSTMHGFIGRATTSDIRDFTSDISASQERRMMEYNALSVRLKSADISRADMIFVLDCYNRCCMNANTRHVSSIRDIKQICAELCIIGSRHTVASRQQSIDASSLNSLRCRVSSWIIQYGSMNSEHITDVLMLSDSSVNVERTTAQQLHVVMNMPHLTHLQSKEDKLQIVDSIRQHMLDQSPLSVFAKEKKNDDIEDEIITEEDMDTNSQRGNYWLTCIPVMVVGLLPFASRIFHQVDLENHVMSLYPVCDDDAFVYPPAAYDNLLSLVHSRCQTTAGDTFVPKFREAVHKWCLPMGALSMRYRNVNTQHQESDAANLAEDELGMDIVQALYNMMNTPLLNVANDVDHELHEILLFYTIGTLIENRCGVEFDSMVIMSCDLLTKHAILGQSVEHHEARRPRIVCIMQRVWIHDQNRWYKCKNLIDAVLKLLMALQFAWKIGDQTHKSRYNNMYRGRHIKPISDTIIGPHLHAQLPSWNTT